MPTHKKSLAIAVALINSSMARLTIIGFCLLLLASCKEEDRRIPLENDRTAPGPVNNVQVENLAGGAKISYTIPADPDLLYVQADYEIRKGVKEEAKASFYNKYLIIQGFGDTSTHTVELCTVDRGGNKSAPVTITVKPLLSPVQQAFDSLSYVADFGGINVHFKNESQANLVITIMIKDSTGQWKDYDKDYTSLREDHYGVRGLPAVSATFGVYIKDRWDNYSDTLIQTLTPLYEEQLDKGKFQGLTLPSDAQNTWTIKNLWDNNTTKLNGFHTTSTAHFPVWFTMDLGIKAQLSRFRIWHVHDGREYSSGNFKQFEVWGSNAPNPDGSFDASWTLLGTYEAVKPSGLPGTQLSEEDVETAAAGIEFVVPIDAPAVRYIRFKVISTYDSPPNTVAGVAFLVELSFWGSPEL